MCLEGYEQSILIQVLSNSNFRKMAACEETQEIGEGKLFSPGNLRATFDNTNYAKVYMELSYT
jgi:hypothetical protein